MKKTIDNDPIIASARKSPQDSKTLAEVVPNNVRDRDESMRIWNRYTTQNKPGQIREQLIRRYAYVVNWVIGRFPYIETADFDREDLLGYGTIGLIEAVDRYNPQQKCSFETFAINRVRGEILDFLRSRDFLSRTGRTRVKRFNEAVAKLERQFGRAPNDTEVKTALNIDSEDLRQIKTEASALIFSLDSTEATRPFEESKVALVDNLASENQSQEEYTDQNILKDKLAKAIDSLNPRERIVVALYHYQKLTFREIGEVLGVSESRASQLHMKVLQKLKILMKGYEI